MDELKKDTTKSTALLNPDWTCWLMGYPDGWLNYADSEIQSVRKSRKSLQKQSEK